MKALLTLLSSCFGAFCIASFGAHATPSPAQKHLVKVGVIVPLTGSLASRGQDVLRTVELLLSEQSQRSSRYEFRVHVEDGRCGVGNAAVSAIQKLIASDHIQILFVGCSGETLQAAPIAQRAGVLSFAVMATHQDVKKIGPLVFRTFVDLERGMEEMIAHLHRKGEGKIALFSEENSFTIGLKQILEASLAKELTLIEDFPVDSDDFKPLLIKVKALSPKIIFMNAFSPRSLVAFVTQVRRMGLTQPIYTNLQGGDASFVPSAGSAAESVIYMDTPAGDPGNVAFVEFLQRYRKRYEDDPSFEYAVRTTFDAVRAAMAGVEAVGTNSEDLARYLHSYSQSGALGKVEFDEHGDIKNMKYVLKQIVRGHSVLVEK